MNNPSKILLLGDKGMLGRAWRGLLEQQHLPFAGFDLPELDITDPRKTDDLLASGGFDLVVNCAAWTDVDGAEANEYEATRVNSVAVLGLALNCKAHGIKLVHYSTDYIFDGLATQPYKTDHPPAPINAYGRSKLAGEQAVADTACDHLLIRTSWLYAPWGKNFVTTIYRMAKERDTLRVVTDQRGRPTSAEHLARATLQLLNKNAAGTWHVADGGECSWHDFAVEIARHANPACRVEPCTSEEFPRPAKRPAYSVLDITQTENEIGPLPTWQRNLNHVLHHIT